jgi:hypothetical protein
MVPSCSGCRALDPWVPREKPARLRADVAAPDQGERSLDNVTAHPGSTLAARSGRCFDRIESSAPRRSSTAAFHAIANSDRVSFFLGSRKVESLGSDMISRWDVSALNAIKDPISKHVESESFEVLTRDTGRSLDAKEWLALRGQATGNAVVSIGSPIASASTEYLLAEMFNVPAMGNGRNRHRSDSPTAEATSPAPLCWIRRKWTA